jgi:subtilisin family serine protease
VDLAAPGVDILLAAGPTTNAYYGAPGRSGTSYACPYVAGAVALLASAYPAATAAELKAAILNGVDLVPALTNKMVTHGRLNVAKAIELIVPPALLITNLSVSPDGQSLSFTWKVRAAKTYRVQYKNNLNELDWIDLPTVPTISGSTASITDIHSTISQRFYRVVQLD